MAGQEEEGARAGLHPRRLQVAGRSSRAGLSRSDSRLHRTPTTAPPAKAAGRYWHGPPAFNHSGSGKACCGGSRLFTCVRRHCPRPPACSFWSVTWRLALGVPSPHLRSTPAVALCDFDTTQVTVR